MMFLTKRQLAIWIGFMIIGFVFRHPLELAPLWMAFISLLLLQVFRLTNELSDLHKAQHEAQSGGANAIKQLEQLAAVKEQMKTGSAPQSPARPPALFTQIFMRHFKVKGK